MFFFTIDGVWTIHHYRFQDDGTWRRIPQRQGRAPQGIDLIVINTNEAISVVQQMSKVVIDEKELLVNPTQYSINQTNALFVDPRLHRTPDEPIPKPNIENLREVFMAAKDKDKEGGILILDVHGTFSIVPTTTIHQIKKDPLIAVRHEVFAANTGILSGITEKDINFFFNRMFAQWCSHVQTGTQRYVGD